MKKHIHSLTRRTPILNGPCSAQVTSQLEDLAAIFIALGTFIGGFNTLVKTAQNAKTPDVT